MRSGLQVMRVLRNHALEVNFSAVSGSPDPRRSDWVLYFCCAKNPSKIRLNTTGCSQ